MNFKYMTKSGVFDFKLKYNEADNYYTLKALDSKKEMGMATFLFKSDRWSRKLWLQYIETKEKYAHSGIATAMIQIVEYFAYKNHVEEIEGKYYPKNEFAKPFYEKNGYDIDQEDYNWYIDKYLDFDKVKKYKNNFVLEKEHDEENLF